MNKENEEIREISPTEYFTELKGKVDTISTEELENMYKNCILLFEKYKMTGQTKALMNIVFQINCIEKEMQLCKLGITKFVYRQDIEYYIDNVAKNVVKVIELENYTRDIPDSIAHTIINTKHIFHKMYVVFTDYTGEIERQVEKERRDKDPILFGTFESKGLGTTSERFYYLGDWIDEYCDLTLDKMIKEINYKNKSTNKNIVVDIDTRKEIDSLKKQLKDMEKQLEPKKKKSLLSRIKKVFR